MWTVYNSDNSEHPHYWVTYRAWYDDSERSYRGFQGENTPPARTAPVRHPDLDRLLEEGRALALPNPVEEPILGGYREDSENRTVRIEFGTRAAADAGEFTDWLGQLRAFLDEVVFGTVRQL